MSDRETSSAIAERGRDDEFERMTRIANSLIETWKRDRRCAEGYEPPAYVYLANAFLKYAPSSERFTVIEECAKACEERFADPAWSADIRGAAATCASVIRRLLASPPTIEQRDEKGRPMTYWGGRASPSTLAFTADEDAKVRSILGVVQYDMREAAERDLRSILTLAKNHEYTRGRQDGFDAALSAIERTGGKT